MKSLANLALLCITLALCACTQPQAQPTPSINVSTKARPMNDAPAANTTTAAAPAAQKPPAFTPGKPLAQIMGVQWVGVLASKDYPTEWNLLWVQDRVKKNTNDTNANHKPGHLYTGFGGERQARENFMSNATGDLLGAYRSTLASDPTAFYTVRLKAPQPRWYDQQVMFATHRRIIGIELEGDNAQKAREKTLTPEGLKRWVESQVWDVSDGNSENLNPQQLWPTATVDLGERPVGFISLARALRYLEANPQRPVWVMSWDAPDWPKNKQPSENAVLLILTHPEYRHPFPRKPLALLYAPQRVQIDRDTSRLAANKTAFAAAAQAAGVAVKDIGSFHHDIGPTGDVAAGRASGPMFQALTELGAFETSNDPLARTAAVDKYLKNAGTNAALMNLALATALVQHEGKPAMVLGVSDDPSVGAGATQASYAVVLSPPPGHRVPAARTEWPRARGLGQAYWPWWGELLSAPK
jgi:hypothetical protein